MTLCACSTAFLFSSLWPTQLPPASFRHFSSSHALHEKVQKTLLQSINNLSVVSEDTLDSVLSELSDRHRGKLVEILGKLQAPLDDPQDATASSSDAQQAAPQLDPAAEAA